MTDAILRLLHALPRLLLPFVPLFILFVVAVGLAALSLVVVRFNADDAVRQLAGDAVVTEDRAVARHP